MQERQRLEYLHAMGIEVWCSRSASLLASAQVIGTGDHIAGPLNQDPIEQGPIDQVPHPGRAPAASEIIKPDETASGDRMLVKYSNCLVILDLPSRELKHACLQLLDNIVQALGIEAVQQNILIAPLHGPKADSGDLLHQKVSQLLGGTRSYLLVFGDSSCKLLFNRVIDTFSVTEYQGRKSIAGKELDALLNSVELKRSLWHAMQQHLSGS
jgi:hypothetical protein